MWWLQVPSWAWWVLTPALSLSIILLALAVVGRTWSGVIIVAMSLRKSDRPDSRSEIIASLRAREVRRQAPTETVRSRLRHRRCAQPPRGEASDNADAARTPSE